MAFYTFTEVRGSAAAGNLVITVTNALGAGETTLTVQGGYLAFTNVQGNTTVSTYTPANFAALGIPSATTNGTTIGMTLSTFQSSGLAAKLQGAGSIDATGATPTQIDALIANSTGASPASLSGAAVDVGQFVSLKALGLFAAGGAEEIDATDATTAQYTQLYSGASLIATGAIINAELLYSEFQSITAAKFADGEATVNAAFVTAGTNTDSMITYVLTGTNENAINEITNVSVQHSNLVNASFADFVALVADKGITSVASASLTTTDFDTIETYRTSFAQGSIQTGVVYTQITVDQAVSLIGKFAAGAISTLDLTSATSADVDVLVANTTKLAVGSGSAGLLNADITASQFESLANFIKTGNATVDATDATSSEVTAILRYLGKFATSGLSGLSLTANEFNSVTVADLTAAVANGGLVVTAKNPSIIAGGSMTKAFEVVGSTGADNITTGTGADTVQGGKGADSIVGGNGADLLKGGNAADTINGGAGADTIYGGNSIAANVLTGGSGADIFYTNGGLNTITDLGYDGTDVVVVSAGVTTTATTGASWTASAATANLGTFVIQSGDDHDIDLSVATGSNGYTILGSSTTNTQVLTGSNMDDVITNGAGNTTVTGGLGQNTITAGAGTDKITVAASATDSVYGLGGSDVLIVSGTAGAVTVTSDWSAGAATIVTGTLTNPIALANGIDANMSGITAADTNWSISAAGNTLGSTITGDGGADTLVGGAGSNTLTGNGGADRLIGGAAADSIVGGSGADSMTGGAGIDTFSAATGTSIAASTATLSASVATGNSMTFTSGVDIITDFTAGAGGDVLALAGGAGVMATSLLGMDKASGVQVNDTNYYLSGTWDAATKKFTVTANGSGTSTLIVQGENAAALADTTSAIVLVGVDSDTLTTANFG